MCDTLVALTDDGPLFAKNSDRDPNEAQLLEWHPAATHAAGSELACTWIKIPQSPSTRAVVLSRPWWIWGAEMGANDSGVVIGNEAVFTRGAPFSSKRREAEPGLLGMDMLRLALERAGTAHEAVGVIVEMLERHGQGGSYSFEHPGFSYDNSFIVADPDGAVVLETAGRAHATEVVTAPGRSISNGLTIAGFAEAHSDPLRTTIAQARSRRACTESAAGRARDVPDMFAALRDHGPARGRAGGLNHTAPTHPRYRLVNGALSAPCAHAGGLLTSTQSTASWVADLRGEPRHWATGTSAPCTSVFKPVSVDSAVDTGPPPSNTFDRHSLWWNHELLHRAVMRHPAALLGLYRAERDALEARWVAEHPEPADAFAEAAAAERRWSELVTEAVRAGAAPDGRPPLVRRLWRRWNAAARMPSPPF